MIRRLLIPALSLWLATAALSAGPVSVLVLDPDGRPVPGATVRAGDATATTGADGRVAFDAPGAAVELAVEANGFARSIRSAARLSGETVVQLSIRPLETPVVVTGVSEPRALAEIDRSLVAIDVDERQSVSWSFADLLKQDSSIHMRERGADGTQADISIRGAGFDQALVMINGVRVSDAQTGHHSLNLPLPLEAVHQVEILRGSGSTLYGSDAIGGTINFVTRKPEAAELRLMGGLGEHGWNRSSARGAVRRGIWTQTLSAARDFSTGFAPGRDFRNVAVSGETFLDSRIGSTSILAAANDRPFGANGFYGPWNSWEDTSAKFVSATQTLGRNPDQLQHRLNFAFRRHRDHFVLCREGCVFGETQFAPDAFQNFHRLDTWQGNYGATGRLHERVRWAAGAQYLSEAIDSTVAGQRQRGRGAAYLNLDLRPTSRLTVSAGVREEMWRKWSGQTSPNLAVGYWLGQGVKIRAQAGAAFRIPTYTDLYHRDPGNVGNADLVPERAGNYEAGADWLHRSGLQISATAFRRLENNTIDWIRDAGSAVFQARNFQELDFRGGEFDVRRRFGRGGEVWGAYTVLRASRRLPENAVSRYVFNFPLNQFVGGYRGTLGRGLLVKTQFGAYNRTWQSTRALWDVSLGWNSGRWRPFVQATNLLQTRHEAFPGLAQPGRWFRGGLEWLVF